MRTQGIRATPWRFVALVAVALAASVLAACGGSATDEPEATTTSAAATTTTAATTAEAAATTAAAETTAAEGPWAFTDDRGVEVSADSMPLRIVAQEDAAGALMHLGITPVGIFGGSPLADSTALSDVDVSGIESVGETWGEINLEKLAALQPDLIVTTFYSDPDTAPLWGFDNDGQQAKAETIAPIVALDANPAATQVIGRFSDLAAALGVDLESPELVAAHDRADAALEALRTVVEENPGLRVLAISTEPDVVSVAQPGGYQDLLDYESAGLDVVDPGGEDPYWESLSWEQVDKYPADVILYDARPWSLDLQALAKHPTWNKLPAVEADQIVPWQVGTSTSYDRFAKNTEALVELLQRSKVVAPES